MLDLLQYFNHQTVITDRAERFDLLQAGLFQRGEQEEQVELVRLEPNAKYAPHYHKKSAAIIYLIAGNGTIVLGAIEKTYQANQCITIPAGMRHGFKTNSETVFLSIQTPSIIDKQTGEIDIYYESN